MAHKDISSMRSTVELLKEEGEVFVVEGEVDPIYEISGIQASLEGGPALLFNRIKGYPGVRNLGNIFSNRQRVAKMFDVDLFILGHQLLLTFFSNQVQATLNGSLRALQSLGDFSVGKPL